MVDEHFESNSPLYFRLTNTAVRDGRQRYVTHCGVLEFIADEGRMYIPEWMMKSLHCRGGDFVQIQRCRLEKGNFVKLEPQSVDFLDVWDPRAALENSLKLFHTLTKNDIISIQIGENVFGIKVLEVEPESADGGISIHETDLNVDFAPPVGYVEPERKPAEVKNMAGFVRKLESEQQQKVFAKSFAGQGRKLNSKEQTDNVSSNTAPASLVGIRMPRGKLFIPQVSKPPAQESEAAKSGTPFQGTSHKINDH